MWQTTKHERYLGSYTASIRLPRPISREVHWMRSFVLEQDTTVTYRPNYLFLALITESTNLL